MRDWTAERVDSTPSSAVRGVFAVQAAYFLSGLWPLLHRRSFEAVTGPKHDYWLVRTVGGLMTVVGAVLTLAAWRGRDGGELRLLGVGASGVLGSSAFWYALRGRIRRVYFLDAAAEFALAGALLAAARAASRAERAEDVARRRAA